MLVFHHHLRLSQTLSLVVIQPNQAHPNGLDVHSFCVRS